MMMSFPTIYGQVQNLLSDNSATTKTLIKNLINQTQGNLLALRKDITEISSTATTTASTQSYNLPYNYGKMLGVTITVSSRAYPVSPLEDDKLWFNLNIQGTGVTSDIPQYYRIFNDLMYIYPTPASSSNTITYYYHKNVRDMTFDDYTTGTVDIITNAATAVTGSSTVWTTPMIGRFFRVTPSNTATADGDGIWYEIATRTSNTVIGLKKNYNGTSLTTGAAAAYIIGEMPIIPEAYHEMLVWRPTAICFQQRKEMDRAKFYWELYGAMEKRFIEDRSSKVESGIIDSEHAWIRRNDGGLRNPNDWPSNLA